MGPGPRRGGGDGAALGQPGLEAGGALVSPAFAAIELRGEQDDAPRQGGELAGTSRRPRPSIRTSTAWRSRRSSPSCVVVGAIVGRMVGRVVSCTFGDGDHDGGAASRQGHRRRRHVARRADRRAQRCDLPVARARCGGGRSRTPTGCGWPRRRTRRGSWGSRLCFSSYRAGPTCTTAWRPCTDGGRRRRP